MFAARGRIISTPLTRQRLPVKNISKVGLVAVMCRSEERKIDCGLDICNGTSKKAVHPASRYICIFRAFPALTS